MEQARHSETCVEHWDAEGMLHSLRPWDCAPDLQYPDRRMRRVVLWGDLR